MRRLLILGLLASSTMLEASDRIRIGIRLQTPPGMPPSLLNALIRETERHWNFPALELRWHHADRSCKAPDNRLLIVHLVGECTLFRPEAAAVEEPLGHTHVSDNKVLPFIDVNCQAVAASVARRQQLGVFLNEDSYARALAAVLTHEMVHALTESRAHETAGVMRPKLSPEELIQEDAELTPDVIENLEEALHVNLSEERQERHQ